MKYILLTGYAIIIKVSLAPPPISFQCSRAKTTHAEKKSARLGLIWRGSSHLSLARTVFTWVLHLRLGLAFTDTGGDVALQDNLKTSLQCPIVWRQHHSLVLPWLQFLIGMLGQRIRLTWHLCVFYPGLHVLSGCRCMWHLSCLRQGSSVCKMKIVPLCVPPWRTLYVVWFN